MAIHGFLQGLLFNSLVGSGIVIIILIFKKALSYKVKAGWYYCIWLILVIRLLMPSAPESPWSVANLFHWCVDYYHTNQTNRSTHSTTSPANQNLRISNQQFNGDEAIPIRRLPVDLILFTIWCLGVFIWLVVYIIHSIGTIHSLRKNYPLTDSGILKILGECQRQLGIRRIRTNIALVETPCLKSPALYGVFHPTIMLPDHLLNKLDPEQLRHILLHELAHYKRKDIILNLITHCLQALYWFNPIIAYGFHQMREDRESACDEMVLSSLPSNDYFKYGHTVIELLQLTSTVHAIPTITLFGGKECLKKRISHIAVYKKPVRLEQYAAITVFFILGCVFLTNAPLADSNPTYQATPAGPENVKPADLRKFFKGYNGSFVLYDQEKAEYSIYNSNLSYTRLSPYSTFKIFDALIALESGVLSGPTAELHWDGTHYSFPTWNQDQTLQSAMNYSVDWYFGKVNSKIGTSKMQFYLNRIAYGNNDISGGIGDFWVDSSLMISPFEQVELLKKLYNYQLPFSRKNIDDVKQIIRIAKYRQAVLSGKTGTANINNHTTNGWFVGYVEKGKNVYYFATNIQRFDGADGKKAREITLQILKARNIAAL